MKNNKGKLYCLIRSKSNVSAQSRFIDTLKFYFGDQFVSKMESRIVTITGDIVLNSHLGISNMDLVKLIRSIDVVINSAALVKHFGKQKEFENINVTGTKNVIDFCKRYGKRLMHVSTVSVSGTDRKLNITDETIFSEKNLYIGQSFTNIYISTKYEAEIAVLEAIYDGLDAQILRLGNITNRYSDGMFQRNAKDNAFANRLKSFIEIGAFPRYLLEHKLEFTPVDLSANAIIKILNHSSDCNMFHLVDPLYIPIQELVQTMNSMGADMIPVSNTLMNDIINGMLTNDDRKQAVSGIIQDLNKDKKLIYTSAIKLSFAFTESYLKNCRFPLEEN